MPYPSLDTGPDDGVEKWDLTTWETEILPWTCPTGVDYFDAAWAISDHEIIFTTGPAKKGKEAGEGKFYDFIILGRRSRPRYIVTTG